MAGSAVDAMLKAHGLEAGSLYARIEEALTKNLLTQGMADWAHNVRLGSNRPRRADKDKPHVSPNEAKQSVEFAEGSRELPVRSYSSCQPRTKSGGWSGSHQSLTANVNCEA